MLHMYNFTYAIKTLHTYLNGFKYSHILKSLINNIEKVKNRKTFFQSNKLNFENFIYY